jgi:hypothetical protein
VSISGWPSAPADDYPGMVRSQRAMMPERTAAGKPREADVERYEPDDAGRCVGVAGASLTGVSLTGAGLTLAGLTFAGIISGAALAVISGVGGAALITGA